MNFFEAFVDVLINYDWDFLIIYCLVVIGMFIISFYFLKFRDW